MSSVFALSMGNSMRVAYTILHSVIFMIPSPFHANFRAQLFLSFKLPPKEAVYEWDHTIT